MKHFLPFLFLSILLFSASCKTEKDSDNDQVAFVSNQECKQLEEMLKKPFSHQENIRKGTYSDLHLNTNEIGRYYEIFNDSNKYQYAYAEKYGVSPIETLNDAYNTSRPLEEITTCKYYTVDKLTHSLPFLTPEASLLLKLIGRNFIDSLNSRGADGYKIITTSLLRTPASVKSLRRVNVNASDSSCHKFATTFDISHSRFDCRDSSRTVSQASLKALLAEVLLDLRKQNLCMVKYERKTACFHITVTPNAH